VLLVWTVLALNLGLIDLLLTMYSGVGEKNVGSFGARLFFCPAPTNVAKAEKAGFSRSRSFQLLITKEGVQKETSRVTGCRFGAPACRNDSP
jgi:hypothetical protein